MGIAASRIASIPPEGAGHLPDDRYRRAELRAFLMSRRARLRPEDVGLPDTARRRTPGLRREEVALLAGLSTEWYTLFEMAKSTGVSRRTIDAVAAALRLTVAEARQLHVLVLGTEHIASPGTRAVDASLHDVLDGYRTGPAMLMSLRLDVVGANALATAIFGDLAAASGFERNWLWYAFAHRNLFVAWEEQARQLTATFRASQCSHATDPEYVGLLDTLLATSEVFRGFWSAHDVGVMADLPPLELLHPTYGSLRFTVRVLAQAGPADTLYCCFLVPDRTTAAAPAYVGLRHAVGA